MNADAKIQELWTLRLKPSDLYNIERTLTDNPETGGGHTYIQVPRSRVEDLLEFLKTDYPSNGVPIHLSVGDPQFPGHNPETLEFWSKSAERMRIARQNRHRHHRLTAWSPQRGFPSLQPHETTDEARALLDSIGGLHIFLARQPDGFVWAGFTTGTPSSQDAKLPFAGILWGSSPGGYWIYEDK